MDQEIVESKPQFKVKLQPYQDRLVFSKTRHPCMVGGWGTGKTMSAILRANIYSELIPNNLGIIFRKTFVSLRDSTMRDFEQYTGLKISSNRDVVYPDGSRIMFRHLDELDSINQQNINLGWFMIEQGEELDSDKEFFMLFGRLRRKLEPTERFKELDLPIQSGWVIANAGDNWIKKLWKEKKLIESAKQTKIPADKFTELIEATTWDNAENLGDEFLDSLRIMEKAKPEIYKQFVMNDWTIGYKNKVFNHDIMELMKAKQGMILGSDNSGVSIDPAGDGVDENVFMAGRGGEVRECFIRSSMSPSDRCHQAIQMCKRIDGSFIIVDCDGVGIDTYLELMRVQDTYSRGIAIVKFHGSAPSELMEADRKMFQNCRAEAAFTARKRAIEGRAAVDDKDYELIEDLAEEEFFTNKRGLIQLEPKEDIKERLGRSPGRGDCWKMLQYGFSREYQREQRAYHEENALPSSYKMEESLI